MEDKFAYFDLQTSADGYHFESLRRVNPMGENSVYSVPDPSRGTVSYYRLKMVDVDGSYAYSRIISGSGTNALFAFPNPS